MNRLTNEPPLVVYPPTRRKRLNFTTHTAIIPNFTLHRACSIPPTQVGGIKELFDFEDKLCEKIAAFNVAMTTEDVKKREKTTRANSTD